MQVFVPSCYSTVHSNFVRPLLFTCAKTYGSAISSPSDASGVATFDNIGLFDLPKGAIFQVFIAVSKFMLILCGSIFDIHPPCQVVFAFSPGVLGAVWSNATAVPTIGECFRPLLE